MDFREAVKVISETMKKDKTGGSMFYAWQSNLACIIMDNSVLSHEESNDIAVKFLNRLIGD